MAINHKKNSALDLEHLADSELSFEMQESLIQSSPQYDSLKTKVETETELKIDAPLVCLCLITMLSNCAYALVAPFLPIELEKAGISKAYTGPIFSMYSVAVIICSPIIGKYIKHYGRRNFVQFGLIAMSLSMFGFALGSCFEGNLVLFLTISLLTRFI